MKSIDMKSMGAMNGLVDMGGLELPTHKPLQPCDFPRTAFTSKWKCECEAMTEVTGRFYEPVFLYDVIRRNEYFCSW